MNHEKLSSRLQQAAIHIPKGSILADIGSDHAYLPCYAVQQGFAEKAIAGEISEGPFRSACSQVESLGLEDKIDVRKGDGLEVLQQEEATCITICGMGGALITSILENGKDKLSRTESLILQPNIAARPIRQWLLDNGWELSGEDILEEDGKIYEILTAVQGDPEKPYLNINREAGLIFGPFLAKEQSDVFRKKWELEKAEWQRILQQLEEKAQGSSESEMRKQELQRQIKLAEEVLG